VWWEGVSQPCFISTKQYCTRVCIDLPLTVFEIHIWYLYKITASYIDTQLQYCFVKLITNSNFKVY